MQINIYYGAKKFEALSASCRRALSRRIQKTLLERLYPVQADDCGAEEILRREEEK